MGADLNSCAICDGPPANVRMRNSGVIDGLLIECPLCGLYELIGYGINYFACPADQ